MHTPSFHVLIPCAGKGERSGVVKQPKQYQDIAGQPMVFHTLHTFLSVSRIARLLVVLHPDDTFVWPDQWASVERLYQGGETRAASVLAGLLHLQATDAHPQDWVLVHDAARCLIEVQQIEKLIEACEHHPVGGLLAVELADTLKQADAQQQVEHTCERQGKWLAQTPQMFRLQALITALEKAGEQVSDEASAIEALGHFPLLVRGTMKNFKITYPEDWALAASLLSEKRPAIPPSIRIGQGWDSHRLVENRPLILGGVLIPFEKGLMGHSDADVLLHAITDAVLGAAGMGDIGQAFPDHDPQYQGADSWHLLALVAKKIAQMQYQVSQVDCTLIAQAPRLSPYKQAMIDRIAQALKVPPSAINVKAKTAEGLGPVGEGLSIEAQAMVVLIKE